MALQRQEVFRSSPNLVKWVDEVASKTKPDRVVWCDGSDEEYRSLVSQMVDRGVLIELNQKEYPSSYLYRSDSRDVARSEASTFICTKDRNDAGPTNNWMSTNEALELLWKLFDGCMVGRTMYVVPYLMGPVSSRYSQVGVEITDSPYVVASLRLMTRMGAAALNQMMRGGEFVKGIHSTGTLDPEKKYICHFPEERLVMSINSNYGGNALLSKKCHSLRIASVMARDYGWLAEHMMICGLQDKTGDVTYITGAFPSASGKTNLAMLEPPDSYRGYKVLTVGDDIAWLHFSDDGTLHAINPEAGFFCVAPHTSAKTNPNLMKTIQRNTIFTNVALAPGRIPWWEGREPLPANASGQVLDWQGKEWKHGAPAAHPNSRFTVPLAQYPKLSPKFEDPNGVPISAILLGGRRASLVPLVYEALSWEHGILMGAMMKVETTAAAEGALGVIRNDPMAMLPFCGYNMADYFRHWLSFRSKSKNLPRIFQVNWFRMDGSKNFLWPGYGENIRVLKWIAERAKGTAKAIETPIGYIPAPGSIDTDGLALAPSVMEELLRVDREGWLKEVQSMEPFFKSFGDRFPQRLWQEYRELISRLEK